MLLLAPGDYAAALALFDREWPADGAAARRRRRPIRLIGFGVTNIQDSPDDGAPLLFADPEDDARRKRERLSETLDNLRARGLLH